MAVDAETPDHRLDLVERVDRPGAGHDHVEVGKLLVLVGVVLVRVCLLIDADELDGEQQLAVWEDEVETEEAKLLADGWYLKEA